MVSLSWLPKPNAHFSGSFHHHLDHLPKPAPSLLGRIYMQSHIRGIFIVQAVTAVTDGRLCDVPSPQYMNQKCTLLLLFSFHFHFNCYPASPLTLSLEEEKKTRTNQFPLTFLFGFQSLLFSLSPPSLFFVSIYLSSCWVCLSAARIDFWSHYFTAPQ